MASDQEDHLIVGATKKYGVTPDQALCELQTNAEKSWSDSYVLGTQSYLREEAMQIWKHLSFWHPVQLRTGVRALPPMTQRGALPILGYLEPNIWVISGLGSRGVLYHALLGSLTAEAVLKADPNVLPNPLKWCLPCSMVDNGDLRVHRFGIAHSPSDR